MNIETAARETLDDVVADLRGGYLEWLEATYRKTASAASEGLEREPRSWSEVDRARVLFEAIAYMSALLLEHELAPFLTRRKPLFGREPDREGIEAFRASYLRYLPEKLRALGISSVEVPAVGAVAAHSVSAVERVKEYSRAMAGGKAFEHFGACMGRAMDPE